jgi:hypothetical protein
VRPGLGHGVVAEDGRAPRHAGHRTPLAGSPEPVRG